MGTSLLITLEFPSDKGGVANYYKGVAEHWRGDLVVLAPPEGNSKSEILNSKQIQNPNVQIIRKQLLGRFWPHWLTALRATLDIIWQADRYYTCHAAASAAQSPPAITGIIPVSLLQVGQVLPLGYVALLVKWFYGIPYLVYTHGMDVLTPQKSWHKKWLLKYILRQAKIIVANSEFTKGEVVKLGVLAEKVVVVYPCPSLQKNHTNGQSPTNSTNIRGISGVSFASPFMESRIILTVSRLVPRKGIDTVLKALPEVIKAMPDAQYVVIGDGPKISDFRFQISDLKLENHVKFLGEISDEERTQWYQRASVFVLTPRQINGDVEGFGMVFLEANKYGVPVVGSRTGGVTEAVLDGVNGLLVEPDDVHGTAQAIIKLLTDKPYADKLGKQGKERVFKEFQWEKQVDKLLKTL